ncbi:MAG TPA: hypothetical protein VE863_22635 [Pyrinomonadaceae bacterium]|jgi:hypothetical protein|nr:hypothetical protein [Pyrinomonadaceae bacterium]
MNQDERAFYTLSTVAAGAALLLGAALLVAAISLGAQLLTSWLIVFFHILLLIVISAIAIGIVGLVTKRIVSGALQLAKEHPALAKAAKNHRSAFAAVFVLAATVLPLFSAPFFGDNVLLATAVTVVMTVLFFFAAGNMNHKKRWRRWFGFTVWYISALSLPVTIGFYHHWSFTQIAHTSGINTPGRIALFFIVALAIIVLPQWTPEAA